MFPVPRRILRDDACSAYKHEVPSRTGLTAPEESRLDRQDRVDQGCEQGRTVRAKDAFIGGWWGYYLGT